MGLTEVQRNLKKKWMFWKVDEEKLIHELEKREVLPFPLYHGTNTFALSLSRERRAAIRKGCEVLASYYHQVCKAGGYDPWNHEDECIRNSYGILDRFCDCSSNFEYEATYLTASFRNAAGYAERSWYCGELHYAVHWMQTWMKDINAELPAMSDEQQDALRILKECESGKEPEKVVLRFDDFPKKDVIANESGTDVNWNAIYYALLNGMLQDGFRVSEGYSLSRGKQVPISDGYMSQVDEEEEERAEKLQNEFKKASFAEAMVQQGFSPEDIQAFLIF